MMKLIIPSIIATTILLAGPRPAGADLWDFSGGTAITDWSTTKGDIKNMLGGNFGPAFDHKPKRAYTLFADNLPAGTVHFVEWQTTAPITLRSFSLKACHDGLPADALLRGFSCFRLFAEDPATGKFDVKLYEISPTNPYGDTPEPAFTYLDRKPSFAHPSTSLSLTANVPATTAQRFRAEFVQFGPANSYASGPRVIELNGFDTYYPDRPYPVSREAFPIRTRQQIHPQATYYRVGRARHVLSGPAISRARAGRVRSARHGRRCNHGFCQ